MYQVCRMVGAWIFIDVKVIVLLVFFFFKVIIELNKNFILSLLVFNSANFVFSTMCKILR